MRGVEEMWDSAGGRGRRAGKGSNEAGEMYVWLPISNIYEEQALGLAGRRGRRAEGGSQAGRILCYASIEKWADLEEEEELAGAVGQYTCRICIFNIFCLGESTSSAASQPLSTVCMEWYCQASRGRGKVRKVPILFTESCRASNFC